MRTATAGSKRRVTSAWGNEDGLAAIYLKSPDVSLPTAQKNRALVPSLTTCVPSPSTGGTAPGHRLPTVRRRRVLRGHPLRLPDGDAPPLCCGLCRLRRGLRRVGGLAGRDGELRGELLHLLWVQLLKEAESRPGPPEGKQLRASVKRAGSHTGHAGHADQQ